MYKSVRLKGGILYLFLTVVLLLGLMPAAVTQGSDDDPGSAAALRVTPPGDVKPPEAFHPPDPNGVQRLVDDTGGKVQVNVNQATGTASFVRLTEGASLSLTRGTSATVEAAAFLKTYGGVFGITYPAAELELMDSRTDNLGMTHQTYQQVYKDVEVFAGVIRVHFDAANGLTAINGTFIPDVDVNTTPGLTAGAAAQVAINAVLSQDGLKEVSTDIRAVHSELQVFRTGLVQGVVGPNHLVYEVEVSNGTDVREFVFVDAHTGKIVDQYTGIHVAKSRQTYDANFDSAAGSTSVLCRGEGDGPIGDQACDEAHDFAGDTYDYFFNAFGRDSLDDAGMTMTSYVNVCPGGVCPWTNASWNGQFMSYGTTPSGRPWTADDTVAHEFGHGITDFTSELIYQWQSGAINEALSDIYGETVDRLNGAGLDAPDLARIDYPPNSTGTYPGSAHCVAPFGETDTYPYTNVRWLQGEQDYLIRDMWAPSCYGDPDHVTHPNYHCTADDNGGVHINSGVVNHHFGLLVDGGTFNGQVISNTGLTKAGAIYYQAQTAYLTPASNFAELAMALASSCNDLIGASLNDPITGAPSAEVISALDCIEVDQASVAVELSFDPGDQCGFVPLLDPDAPALCEGVGTVESISLTDWESGLGAWTVGTRDVANPDTFDTLDWAVVGGLPASRPGMAAFVENKLALGNCADDTEAGVLYLESPAIVLPATAFVPRVAFDHWVATELGWDGGNVKVSVNGGPWTIVPGAAFDFNAYNQNLNGGGNDNPMAGEQAFTGTDEGTVDGSWGQSQLNLFGIASPGDTIQLRMEMGQDGCNGVIGWYVDDVNVYACSDEVPGANCGNGVLDLGETCDDGNTANGDGCSDICLVEQGWVCTDPVPPSSGTNVVADGSFEDGIPNPSWTEFSTNFGTPVCSQGICGGPPPSDGIYHVWFGGVAAYEAGSVEQSVVIPATGTNMEFDLLVGVCDSLDDYMRVTVDGNVAFSTDPCSEGTDYATQSVPIGAYADDGAHTLRFESETFATNSGNSNFFVDNVVINDNEVTPGQPSVCSVPTSQLVCNEDAVGFDLGIPSGWTVIDNEGSGLVWTNIAGSGEAGNFTGGSGDAASVSSDIFGPAPFDTELRSPHFDLSGFDAVTLDYLANYQNFGFLDFLDLDISTDGGSTWTNLLRWNEDYGVFRGTPGEAVSIDLAAYARQSGLMLRWRYYDPNEGDEWNWYAQVNEIGLTCESIHGTITIVKEVFGPDPIEDWEFSGDLGDFTLPGGGGQVTYDDLTSGSYTVSELSQFAYGAAVTCSNGASGTDSVSVDLQPGEDLTCTFANTLQVCDQILDNFDRYPDSEGYAKLGPDWRGAKSQGNYRIVENEVEVLAGGATYWKPSTYGPDQEACVTLADIGKKGHHSVLLKVQGDRPRWRRGTVAVYYDSKAKVVGIENYVRRQGWTTLATVRMRLRDGDVLTGHALHDGTVRAFVNGVLVLETTADPLFADNGGGIGLWFSSWNGGDSDLDDFGGQ